MMGASAATLMIALAGCATNGTMTTGSLGRRAAPRVSQMTPSQLADAERRIGALYDQKPDDRRIGMSYATILRMTGDNDQALAVMRQMAIKFPNDREVLAAYGKAQAAAGQLEQALSTIERAQTPDRPDWRLLSARGAILDQLGRTDEARNAYRKALDIRPNEASTLSNLGMSYVLTGDLQTAESYLRKAAAQPDADTRVRQNLALVVGLQGRFKEAERLATEDLPKEQAEANMAYLEKVLSQQNSWKKLSASNKDGGKTG
ncbi:tetratricopeptide repeat protein [Pararhizobium mangrovi]